MEKRENREREREREKKKFNKKNLYSPLFYLSSSNH